MTTKTFFGFLVFFVTTMSSTHAQIFEVLHAFQESDGSWPQGVLVQADDGTFYGTTHYGPRINAGNPGAGTVFRMTMNGALTTLVFFDFGTNGRYPRAGLVRGVDGSLYGTTYRSTPLAATLFKVASGGEFTRLNALDETTNGYAVNAGLIQAADSNFYGTATLGGTNNSGTVFRMATNQSLTTLVTFNGNNGAQPYARLLQASDGSFYGTTYAGGLSNLGTVFQLTANGEFHRLISFNRLLQKGMIRPELFFGHG